MIEQLAALAENRKIALAATIIAGLLFAYIAVRYAVGDAGLSDGKLAAADFSRWRSFPVLIGLCSTLMLWFMGAAHSLPGGRRKLFPASVLLGPVAIFYVLSLKTGKCAKYFRGPEAGYC